MAKQRVYVHKNPGSWRHPWSVRAVVGDGRYIVSQHQTKANADKAAKRASKKDVRKLLGWK